jgi:uncharacterized protein (TIGR02594 family)
MRSSGLGFERSTKKMQKRRAQSGPAQPLPRQSVSVGVARAQQAANKIAPTEAPKPKDGWDKIDISGKLLGSILIPTVIAVATLYLNSALDDRTIEQKKIDTAVTILESSRSNDLPSLRSWALNKVYTALNLPPEAKKELETAPLPGAANSPAPIGLRPPDPAIIADLRNKLQGTEKTWMEIALSEIGIPSDDRIHEYNIATGLENVASSVPWNSQFVNWVMMKAGYTATHSGSARSWLSWGVACNEKPGAIVVMSLPDPMPSTAGTVGFYVGTDKDNDIIILGGNIFRQVTTTTRPRSAVLGFRCPPES